MYLKSFPNLHSLHTGLTKDLVFNPTPDLVTSADVQVHDVMVTATSMDYDFDLTDVWCARSRWNSLVRQYLDPTALEQWLDLIGKNLVGGKRGLAFMRTNSVASRAGAKESRKWGSCMLGFGFKMKPKPTLTMHSRTTYLGYIGQLDLALAHVLAREVAARLGIGVEDINFVWYLEAGQFHGFRSFAWWFQEEQTEDALNHGGAADLMCPGFKLGHKNLRKFEQLDADGVLYADMSFASQLRVRKRWHSEVLGMDIAEQFIGGSRLKSSSAGKVYKPLPRVHVDDLDFSPLAEPSEAPTDASGIIDEESSDDGA